MANKQTELAIQLTLDNAQLKQGLAQTQSTLSQFAQTAKKLFTAYLGYSAIKSTIQAFQDFNMQIANAQALLGGSASELSAMTNALKRFGGDTNTAIGAIKTMQGHLNELKFGSGALITLAQKYGITLNAYSKPDKALLSLAKRMQGFNRETKVAIMQTLGLDESMQRAFMDGGVELERLIRKQRALGTATEADLKISQDFNNAILDLKDIFSALAREMLRGIMPLLKGFVDLLYKFVEIIRKHKVFVGAFFAGLVVAMTPLLLMFAKMAIASAVAFAPFYAIGAVITAIALIFEDLYGYFMGWDSATGELVKKYPALKKAIEPLRPIILGLVQMFRNFVGFLKDPSWQSFKNIFAPMIDGIKDDYEVTITWLKEKIGEFWDWLTKPFKDFADNLSLAWQFIKDDFSAMINFIKSGLDWIVSIFDSIGNKIKGIGEFVGKFFGKNDISLTQAPAIPSSVANNSNVTISNNVNQNFTTNATAGQIQNATQNALTSSVIAQRQNIGGR